MLTSEDKKTVTQGQSIVFENSDHRMELSYGETAGSYMAFKVYFNGKFVKITKTFGPAMKKANELISSYKLLPETSLWA